MPFDDSVHHAETQTGAPLPFGGEEGLEGPLLFLFRHPIARVGDRHADPLRHVLSREGDAPPIGHGVQRIVDEVDEGLLELCVVPANEGPRRPLLHLHLDDHSLDLGLVLPPGARHLGHVADHLVQVQLALRSVLALSGKVLKTLDGLGPAECGLLDDLEVGADFGVTLELADQLRPAQDDGEGVVEVVGDA